MSVLSQETSFLLGNDTLGDGIGQDFTQFLLRLYSLPYTLPNLGEMKYMGNEVYIEEKDRKFTLTCPGIPLWR